LQDWPAIPVGWRDAGIESDMSTLLQLRTKVNETLEPLRQAGTIGKALDAVLTVTSTADDPNLVIAEKHRNFLPELFIVSHVTLVTQAASSLNLVARHAREEGLVRCPRCWRWVATLTPSTGGEICPRCAEALQP
jgi:isoleucyl-tRNA synthetase